MLRPHAKFCHAGNEAKQGARQLKRSLRVSREDAKRLIDGDYSVLLRYQEPFAAEIYGLMQTRAYIPRTIVQYNRKAYLIMQQLVEKRLNVIALKNTV